MTMPKFRVYFQQLVSTSVEVDAVDPVDAIEVASKSGDMPGPMVHGAFGVASVDESGEWTPVVVIDVAIGKPVWIDHD